MALLAMLLASAIWGCTYPLMKHAFTEMSPYDFIFLRFFITSVLVGVMLIKKSFRAEISKKSIYYSIAIGVFTLASIILQGTGLLHVSSSLSSFISGCPVIFIFFIKTIIDRKIPSVTELICATMCIIGLSLITLNGSDIKISILGIVLTAAGTLAFAFSMLIMEKSSKANIGLIIVMLQNIVCCILSLSYIPKSFEFLKYLSAASWFAVFYCSIVSSLVAYGLQVYAQKKLDSKATSMILMLEPVFGSILAFFFLGEDVFNLRFFVGSVIILSSVGYLSYIQKS